MRKVITCLTICMLLLGTGGVTSAYAAVGGGTTTIGYVADADSIQMEITGSDEVIKGTDGHDYHLTADGNEVSAVWVIKGATSDNTKIDEAGNLAVGVDETATELEIIAYAAENPNRFAVYTVKLVEKTYEIVSIEKKEDINLPYGTTKDQLENELEKNDTFQVTIESNDGKTYVIDVDRSNFTIGDDMIDANGVVKKGQYDISYELILPFIQIDYDGTVYMDKAKDTNITGNAKTGITVTIADNGGGDPNTDNDTPKTGDTGQTNDNGPKTGDMMNIGRYLMLISAAGIMLIVTLVKRRKKDKKVV